MEAIVTPVGDTTELEAVVAALASAPNGGLMLMPGPFMSNRSKQITSLTVRHRLPAVFPFRYYAELGGLPPMAAISTIIIDGRRLMSIVS